MLDYVSGLASGNAGYSCVLGTFVILVWWLCAMTQMINFIHNN